MISTGEFSFKKLGNLVQSIEQDILRMFIRQQITGPLAGALGDFVKSSGGDIFGSIFHDGGIVGASNVARRAMPAYTFAGAPRFHNGLMPDEFPAILQKGETVLPKNTKLGGSTINQTINVNVSASGGGSDPATAKLLAAEIGRQAEAGVRAIIRQERRPGGDLSNSVRL
jgi:hypothetical protein